MTIKHDQGVDTSILLVDDDVSLLRLMEYIFLREGYNLFTATNGQQGLQQFYEHQPGLVILDLMMPVMDGWEACQRIRQLSSVPIIILTGLSGNDNVIRGLDQVGADDYLVKPIDAEVLLAKIRALLRRSALPPELPEARVYDDGYLSLDMNNQQVSVQGQPVKLTPREYQLLVYLYRHADQVRPHQQILEDVWGWSKQDHISIIHLNIQRLRQKLEADPKQPRYLLTVHGIGYRFNKRPNL